MFGELGVPELLVILGIALLIFGPRRLGDLGKGLGEGIRGFKSAIKGEPEPAPAAKTAATIETKQS
ncbi:MAG TPA: twin-arginine translocase TatA/TatE family subunit [Terriglobales bacterium]|nr:twin-arginine translocase TatA/TatE family subunit [Terriglobales bacterium]